MDRDSKDRVKKVKRRKQQPEVDGDGEGNRGVAVEIMKKKFKKEAVAKTLKKMKKRKQQPELETKRQPEVDVERKEQSELYGDGDVGGENMAVAVEIKKKKGKKVAVAKSLKKMKRMEQPTLGGDGDVAGENTGVVEINKKEDKKEAGRKTLKKMKKRKQQPEVDVKKEAELDGKQQRELDRDGDIAAESMAVAVVEVKEEDKKEEVTKTLKRKKQQEKSADFLSLDVESADAQLAKKQKGRWKGGSEVAVDDQEGKPRVIFLSRFPHGFYEDQMLGFFGQFGTVTRLVLSRNKKTGASRHYAFIEFQSAEVAAIVADCLDNYLVDGKILRCKLVPPSDVHPKTFLRSNRAFGPWLRKRQHKAAHDRARNPEEAAKLLVRLRKEDEKRRAKLKAMGIEYDFQGYAALVPSKPKHMKFSEDDQQTAQDS